MPSWNELQAAFNEQETAWQAYWRDLAQKAHDAYLAFKDYLGVTDNLLREDHGEVRHRVMLGKISNGEYVQCNWHELEGVNSVLKFNLGVTTTAYRKINGLYAQLELKRDATGYVFTLLDTGESVTVATCDNLDSFIPVCEMVYRKFEQHYATRPL